MLLIDSVELLQKPLSKHIKGTCRLIETIQERKGKTYKSPKRGEGDARYSRASERKRRSRTICLICGNGYMISATMTRQASPEIARTDELASSTVKPSMPAA